MDEMMKKNPKMGAKLSALKELKKMASSMMGDELGKGLKKKVMVEADDNQGLAKGLEKAKELLDMKKGMMSPEEHEMHEKSEGPEMEDIEDMGDYSESEMSDESMEEDPEAIDAEIQMLMEKKKKLLAMKG